MQKKTLRRQTGGNKYNTQSLRETEAGERDAESETVPDTEDRAKKI